MANFFDQFDTPTVGPELPEGPYPPDPLSPRHRQMLRPREPREGTDLSVEPTDEERAARMARRFGRGRDEGRLTAATEMFGERLAQLPRAAAEDIYTLGATPSRMVEASMDDPYGRTLHETAAKGTAIAGMSMAGPRSLGRLPEPGAYSGRAVASAKMAADPQVLAQIYHKLKAIAAKADEAEIKATGKPIYGTTSDEAFKQAAEKIATSGKMPTLPEATAIAKDLKNVSKDPFDPTQPQHVYPEEPEALKPVPSAGVAQPVAWSAGPTPAPVAQTIQDVFGSLPESKGLKMQKVGGYHDIFEDTGSKVETGEWLGTVKYMGGGKFSAHDGKGKVIENLSMKDAVEAAVLFATKNKPVKGPPPPGWEPGSKSGILVSPDDLSPFPPGSYTKDYSWGMDVYDKNADWLGSISTNTGSGSKYKYSPVQGKSADFDTPAEAFAYGAKQYDEATAKLKAQMTAFETHKQRGTVTPEEARAQSFAESVKTHERLDPGQETKRLRGDYTTPAYWGVSGDLREPTRRVWLSGAHWLAKLYADKHYQGKTNPVWVNTKDFLEIDTKGAIGPEDFRAEIDAARNAGKPGVTLYNNRDSPSLDPNVAPSTTHVVFDATRIKSDRAKEFDPSSSDPLYSRLIDPRKIWYGLTAPALTKRQDPGLVYHAQPRRLDPYEKPSLSMQGKGEGYAEAGPGWYGAESPGVSGRGGYYDKMLTAQQLGRLGEHPGGGGPTRVKDALSKNEQQVLQLQGMGYTDSQIYKDLIESGTSPKEASNTLELINANKARIYEFSLRGGRTEFPQVRTPHEATATPGPGVRYLDARSRNLPPGQGTSNVIVRDVSRLNLEDRYAKLGGKTPPAGNFFDQFDEEKQEEPNFFDKFDTPSVPQGPQPTEPLQQLQAGAEAASAGTSQRNRAQLRAVGEFLDTTGKKAHDLLTGEAPPTPENVLEPAIAATPMGAGRTVASKAARTLFQRQQDAAGVYVPRATDTVANRMRATGLSAVPGAGGPLHKAYQRTQEGLAKAGETAAAEAAYPAGVAAARGVDAEKIADALVGFATKGDPASLQAMAKLRGSVTPAAWNNAQSHMIQSLGGKDKFQPDIFINQYGAMGKRARDIAFGTTKDPLRFQLDAIEAVARRAQNWRPIQTPGGRYTKAAMIGYAMVDPITVLSSVLTARSWAKYLSKPSTAAPIADWMRAYERLHRSGGAPAAVASWRISTNNLRNSLGEDFSDEDMRAAMTRQPSNQERQR